LKIDPHSPEWRAIQEWAAAQIEVQRDLLEDSTLTIEFTQFHRGFIQALRALSALPDAEASRALNAS
jgi:hypothetical protein